jgi:two-component system, LytTR family, sensor kinase
MRWWIHILFWIGIWLWMTSVYVYSDSDLPLFLLYNLLRLPIFIAATYAVAKLVVEKYLLSSPPDYYKALWTFIAIFLGASLIDRLVAGNNWVQPTMNGEVLYFEFFSWIPIAKNAFLLFSVILFGAIVQFYRVNTRNQKRINELQQEKLENELAFLRSQVNPHFLFNTFNNLYAMAEAKGHEELSQGLQGMSKLMRYLTYESNVPKVGLVKEIELIHSFIALQRLRFAAEDDVSITFSVNGDATGRLIAPVLLLPLIENAFKHGQPSWIKINLTINAETIRLEVKNRKSGLQANGDGIGLSNLQKRLNIIYPQKHQLNIDDENGIFKVTLEIPA